MAPRRRARTTRLAALLCSVALVPAACGTRRSDAQLAAADRSERASRQTPGDPGELTASPLPSAQVTTAEPTGKASPSASGRPRSGTPPRARPASGPPSSARPGSGSVPAGPAAVPRTVCPSPGAPVVIGQDGSFSGVLGQATISQRDGLAVWARWVNDHGGLQCHPVKLVQTDNAGRAASAVDNVTSLVKSKRAVAIVGLDAPSVTSAVRVTAGRLGVPVVGGDLTATDWYADQDLFPSGGTTLASYAVGLYRAVAARKVSKVGLLYCQEIPACTAVQQGLPQIVRIANAKAVYQQQVSLLQSGFTAECRAAKQAGVQVLLVAADGASLQRIARSCRAVSFSPVIASAAVGASSAALRDSVLRSAGLFLGTNEVPFAATGTAALTDFHSAYRTYAGGDAPDQFALKGWVSGMLFKAAVDAVAAEARRGAVTTALVRRGLASLKNVTLGGLMPAVTFVAGKPPKPVGCASWIAATPAGLETAPARNPFLCAG